MIDPTEDEMSRYRFQWYGHVYFGKQIDPTKAHLDGTEIEGEAKRGSLLKDSEETF